MGASILSAGTEAGDRPRRGRTSAPSAEYTSASRAESKGEAAEAPTDLAAGAVKVFMRWLGAWGRPRERLAVGLPAHAWEIQGRQFNS